MKLFRFPSKKSIDDDPVRLFFEFANCTLKSWIRAKRYVENRPILLTDDSCAMVTAVVAATDRADLTNIGDAAEKIRSMFTSRLDLLLHARKLGIEKAFETAFATPCHAQLESADFDVLAQLILFELWRVAKADGVVDERESMAVSRTLSIVANGGNTPWLQEAARRASKTRPFLHELDGVNLEKSILDLLHRFLDRGQAGDFALAIFIMMGNVASSSGRKKAPVGWRETNVLDGYRSAFDISMEDLRSTFPPPWSLDRILAQ